MQFLLNLHDFRNPEGLQVTNLFILKSIQFIAADFCASKFLNPTPEIAKSVQKICILSIFALK